jgi:hypothetical protein
MWKEAVVAHFKALPQHFLEALRRNIKILRVICEPAEFGTGCFTNTSWNSCRLS